jgi:hypothetical protein
MTPREEELLQTVNQLRCENALLRQKIDLLVKRVFGSSSEQLNPAQLELLMAVPESSAVAATAVPSEREPCPNPVKKRVPRLPKNLPVVEEVIDPEPVKAQPEQWRCRPGDDVFFRWETSRAAMCLNNIIPVDFTGTMRCDGYCAYRSFANGRNGNIALAGCGAHVRRKFFEAQEQSPKTAGWIMRQIQNLYQVEARLREQQAGPKLRQALRVH